MKVIDSRSFFQPQQPAEPNSAPLLSRHKAASSLGVSVATLDRLTRAGELPRIKLAGKVLYRPESLEAFARRREAWARSTSDGDRAAVDSTTA